MLLYFVGIGRYCYFYPWSLTQYGRASGAEHGALSLSELLVRVYCMYYIVLLACTCVKNTFLLLFSGSLLPGVLLAR